MRKLLQRWHWVHTWSKWETLRTELVSYVWTQPGCYAYQRAIQQRTCEVCGEIETKRQMR